MTPLQITIIEVLRDKSQVNSMDFYPLASGTEVELACIELEQAGMIERCGPPAAEIPFHFDHLWRLSGGTA